MDEKRVVHDGPSIQAVPSAGTLHVNGPTPSCACMVASVFTPTVWDDGAQLTGGALTLAVQVADPPTASLTVSVYVLGALNTGWYVALSFGGSGPAKSAGTTDQL